MSRELTITAPEGYEFTGEVRQVCPTEWYYSLQEALQWQDIVESVAEHPILRKVEPEKPTVREFEIDWDKGMMPVIYSHSCSWSIAEIGRFIDGYRIAGFRYPDGIMGGVPCYMDNGKLIKSGHAIGVLDNGQSI